MSSFFQFVELAAVFVPGFLRLGLCTLALFNLCCIAKTLPVAGTLDTESALGISLTLAYLITVATNILSSMQAPVRSTITVVVQSKSDVEQAVRKSLPPTLRPQRGGHKAGVIGS